MAFDSRRIGSGSVEGARSPCRDGAGNGELVDGYGFVLDDVPVEDDLAGPHRLARRPWLSSIMCDGTPTDGRRDRDTIVV